jgi:hypothetical protein
LLSQITQVYRLAASALKKTREELGITPDAVHSALDALVDQVDEARQITSALTGTLTVCRSVACCCCCRC